MKKKFIAIMSAAALVGALALSSCDNSSSSSSSSSGNSNTGTVVSGSNTTVEISDDTITSEFTLVDESGSAVTASNGVYTISAAGVYTAKGKLSSGQIYVDAEGLEVELDLEGASIASSALCPIYVNTCETFILKAVNETENYIYDNRTTDYSATTSTTDTSDDDNGTGAVFVKNGDLKVKGKGSLSVTSVANSGLHGKDNVTVKNVTMLIKAVNNGIKGNDKVTIEENPTLGIVAGNNGIITSNSDTGTSAQHGYVYINGGSITINSYGDGIDAAYSVVVGTSTDSDGVTYSPTLDIYTNIYSSYTNTSITSATATTYSAKQSFGPSGGNQPGGGFDGGGMSGGTSAEKADDSAKAIKANESIDITAGDIYTYTYDDSLHTNNDETLENGSTPSGAINISGGTLNLRASDDGIHADGTLTISGGEVYISEAYEGVEGNKIYITGGEITVYADNDGINAASLISISGGRLDVNMAASGDVDGIDSNGSLTISGGVVITKGPNSDMAAPIDVDGTISVTGGTLIIVGYAPQLSTKLTKSSSSSGLTSGSHTVTVGSNTISYSNSYSYSGSVTVYASSSATVK